MQALGQEVPVLIALTEGTAPTDEDIRAEAGRYIAGYEPP
jgi:hypothetical protein